MATNPPFGTDTGTFTSTNPNGILLKEKQTGFYLQLEGHKLSILDSGGLRNTLYTILQDRIEAISAVNHPPPNATTISVNSQVWLDDGAGNTSKWTSASGIQQLINSGQYTIDAGGDILINGTKLVINNTTATIDATDSGISAGGYIGNLLEISPLSLFGIVPNDGEGTAYSFGFQTASKRWRYIHAWGNDWADWEMANNAYVAARVVNASGATMNMNMTRTEYTTGTQVITTGINGTIAKLSGAATTGNGLFGAGTRGRLKMKGWCAENPASGGLARMVVIFEAMGSGPPPAFVAIYSKVVCMFLIPSGATDYSVQLMGSGSIGQGIGRQGLSYSYDKGIF
jgi:hypothetical protein